MMALSEGQASERKSADEGGSEVSSSFALFSCGGED